MCYLEYLFPPYDTCQAAKIAEKVFLVARNKRPQREGQTEGQTRCFARRVQLDVSARRLTDYNWNFYSFLFFLYHSIEMAENKRILNHKYGCQFLGLIFDYIHKNLQYL